MLRLFIFGGLMLGIFLWNYFFKNLFNLFIGTLYTVYHYVDGGPDYTLEMQRIVDEFNNETGMINIFVLFYCFILEVGLRQINELEAKLMDIDIQPRPDAQYVVYNRVPKVFSVF